MRGYETTYITSPSATDSARAKFLDKIKGIIKNHDGEFHDLEDWGRRRLAYPIKKETRGYYTHIFYTGNSACVAEIERNMRINESIVRFLSVSLGEAAAVAGFERQPSANVRPALPIENVRESSSDVSQEERE